MCNLDLPLNVRHKAKTFGSEKMRTDPLDCDTQN